MVGLYCLLLAAVAPCFTSTALYTPEVLTYPREILYSAAFSLPGAWLLLGALRVARSLGNDSGRLPKLLVSGLLAGVLLGLLGAGAFYAKFGTYPRPAIAFDFVAAPTAFVAYAKSGSSAADVLVFIGGAVVIVFGVQRVVRRVWTERRAPVRAVATALVGIVLLLGLRLGPWPMPSPQSRFMATEHSVPSTKYALSLLALWDSNRLEAVREYAPMPPKGLPQAAIPVARHVLLVVAECLRADHLPAYGYSRDTTPFIQSEIERWQVFTRAYAHGPRTSDSFPVMFNSQYLAAVDRDNTGAKTFWRHLRSAGVGSAFLSAGAMEWGGVSHALGLGDVDHTFIASDAVPAARHAMTPLRFDYAVDDSLPSSEYVKLLRTEFRDRPSFVTVHLVGSHYPFHYGEDPDIFLPSLRSPGPGTPSDGSPRRVQSYDADTTVSDGTITRTRNSYDNSIVHIDRLIGDYVKALQELGLVNDSVIVVTSDHGESFGEHRTFFHGTTLYEEQVHVPLLIRVGENLGTVRALLEPRRTHVTGQVDLVPTVLDILGVPISPAPFEGVSLLAAYFKPYELLLFRGIGEKVALLTNTRKHIYDLLTRRAEEYSLTDDPGELKDLSPLREPSLSEFLSARAKTGSAADRRRHLDRFRSIKTMPNLSSMNGTPPNW